MLFDRFIHKYPNVGYCVVWLLVLSFVMGCAIVSITLEAGLPMILVPIAVLADYFIPLKKSRPTVKQDDDINMYADVKTFGGMPTEKRCPREKEEYLNRISGDKETWIYVGNQIDESSGTKVVSGAIMPIVTRINELAAGIERLYRNPDIGITRYCFQPAVIKAEGPNVLGLTKSITKYLGDLKVVLQTHAADRTQLLNLVDIQFDNYKKYYDEYLSYFRPQLNETEYMTLIREAEAIYVEKSK